MWIKLKCCVVVFLLFAGITLSAQEIDTKTIAVPAIDTLKINTEISDIPDTAQGKFGYKQLIIPTVLIGYGFIAINNPTLYDFDHNVRDQLKSNTHTDVDQFTLYMPAATVYALNAFGIKGKHNFKDRTIVFATATLLSNLTVKTLKSATGVTRPNGLVDNSFPSGHTTAAFIGAEFLWQEYKDVSVWYGIAGYTVATATGFMRLTNDRHWVSDIVAGAGIGILSTKVAYWLLSPINKLLFKGSKEKNKTAMILPFYDGKQSGGSFVMRF